MAAYCSSLARVSRLQLVVAVGVDRVGLMGLLGGGGQGVSVLGSGVELVALRGVLRDFALTAGVWA